MDVKCEKCKTVSDVSDSRIPIGRSYILCPHCDTRINIFKSLPEGSTVRNMLGLRFLREGNSFHEQYCEPGELWRVVEVISPCPDKGLGKACERENRGRCPNQRLIMRLLRDKTIYRTCLYRKGRRIFDKRLQRVPVGNQSPPHALDIDDDDTTYRIR